FTKKQQPDTATSHPVIPAQAEIQSVQFRSFPRNSCCFSLLDSHFGRKHGRMDITAQSKASSFPQKTATRNSNLKPRHSRAGGNLGLSVQELIG
ncbi:hypothetical protein M5107_11115, partial [Neisseria meningitidis]|nr:hypothetical protein [Neisseria meningitidis]